MRSIIIPLLAVSALTACSPADTQEANTLAADQAPGVLVPFTITPDSATYVEGDLSTFTITGAPAGAFMGMFWTDAGAGAGPCLPIIGGACLDILPAVANGGFYFLPSADGSGTAVSSATVPAGLPPGDYTFQAAALIPGSGGIFALSAPTTVTLAPASVDCAADDAFESNDGTADGAVAVPASGTTGLVVCDEDILDYYSWDGFAGDVVDAAITFSDAEGDLDLFVMDTVIDPTGWGDINGASLEGGTSVSDNEFVSYELTADGTYYLAVYQFADDGTNPGNTYDLYYSVGPVVDCATDDAYESNDNDIAAGDVGAGDVGLVTCDEDEDDWYTFEATALDDVTVSLSWVDADDDLDFFVYEGFAGPQLTSGFTVNNPETNNFVANVSGTHWLNVNQWDGGADATVVYDLAITSAPTVTACPTEEASEDNDDIASAAPAGTVTFPTVGYVCDIDEDDFYQVAVLAGDEVTFDLTIDPADDLDLLLFDGTGAAVASTFNGTGINEQIVQTAAIDDTWTIQVDWWSGTGTGEYTLDVTVAVPPVP